MRTPSGVLTMSDSAEFCQLRASPERGEGSPWLADGIPHTQLEAIPELRHRLSYDRRDFFDEVLRDHLTTRRGWYP
jgi:hypothetical protein